ncbi:phospholipase C type enzyme [Coniochaeta pulveracea]|uniref:Phospholipase C type enzyme n=1 Tax=Coniochaeta pulveracea TaxID=177199 RepID=A0A420Y4A5_9PEZI|nr:phospholipase C type enzyme [Coniochaeta pulveracea]
MSPPDEVRIITLNCWGLKYLSALRQPRLQEIGRRLALTTPSPDIVALQELWTQEDYLSIRSQTSSILPYGKFYHSGVFGGGLAILSKWPIEESSMIRYPLNGRPTAFFRGDFFVGKGVAAAKIRSTDDSYVAHQTAQAWEMAKLLRGAHERGHLVVAAGDFNMVPADLGHEIVEGYGMVRDTWRVVHPESSLGMAGDPKERARGLPVPSADFNLEVNGATSGNVFNTWRWNKTEQKKLGPGGEAVEIPGDVPDPKGKRLDYIFAGYESMDEGVWTVKSVRVCMTERHPELGCSLSDHFGVEATLSYHPASVVDDAREENARKDTATASSEAYSRRLRQRDLQSSLTVTNEDEEEALQNGAFLRLQSPAASLNGETTGLETRLDGLDSQAGLPASTYQDILAIITKYVVREHAQQKWRGVHFFAAVGVTVGCLVAVWFSPRNFVSFILMLVSSLGLVAGTIDGLIALLFVNTELKALKEFEWEILNAKAASELYKIQ